jgi:Xaa-Pro dipeptidase
MTKIDSLFKVHLKKLELFYQQLLQNDHYDYILVFSGSAEYYYADDQERDYRSSANFIHLTGQVNLPDSFCIFSTHSKSKFYYKYDNSYWHEDQRELNKIVLEHYDCIQYYHFNELESDLKILANKMAFIGPNNTIFKSIQFKTINDIKLIQEIYYKRSFKSDYEIECIHEANNIAVTAHLAAKNAFFNGATEYETHIEYLKSIQYQESDLPYPNIIAFNEKAGILHYQNKRRTIEQNHTFLIDAGARFNGYCSDISRTYSNDLFFNDLISFMTEIKNNIIDTIQENDEYKKLHEFSQVKISELLSHFKFIKLSAEEIFHKKLFQFFYPHSLSHFLGIQVHDVGRYLKQQIGSQISPEKDWNKLDDLNKVKNRHVFTIEPGFYLIPSLLDKLYLELNSKLINKPLINKLLKYGGVRIEDDVVFTKNKVLNLTKSLM